MNEDNELIKKRLAELARKAESGGYYTFTDFLGLSEQSAFKEILPKLGGAKYTIYGGAEGAERVVIRFGDADDIGYDVPFSIVCIKIEPKSQKFADRLSHRDFLGALLNLGIERDMLGDIAIIDNVGYLFALSDIAEFIEQSLERVKRTDVTAHVITELPEGSLYRTEARRIQISSERADAAVAKVYGLSRDDAQGLFKRRLVFADGKQIESASYNIKAGEKISVRGFGRFIYRGYEGLSKKGKLNATVDVYI